MLKFTSLFFESKIHYLGHIILGEGIIVNPIEIEVSMDLVMFVNIHEVQNFRGLTWYYRSFVKIFSNTVNPIMDSQKKNKKFVWME